MVLFCAEDDGLFVRLAHGNYIKPNIYPLLGMRYPNYRGGRKIIKSDKARIAPAGPME
ncbi:DUF6088 family protein [Sphingobacterium cellulitidis]|uniref:DUF6088 family protein n=1 Tax=Sphingobacterium cellulitidis TaxID=1768011 RepID=UPI0015F9555F|nr:DUF6088 family protein [Sphingobacterium soli]MBA8984989.1 hypothetical protein [Sphingobacterium soli]